MNEIRNVIKNYTRTISTGDFLNLKLPFMNYCRDFIQVATTLSYPVYEIRHNDNRSHKLHFFMLDFKIRCIDEYRDIYKLYCIKKDGSEYCIDNVYVNDFKTSNMLRSKFNHILKNYIEIEYSDDEENDNDEKEKMNDEKCFMIKCVYIRECKKWKPYKFINNGKLASLSDIKKFENKKY